MAMEPRDHGGPIIKFWEESGTLDKLELVKGWLMKNAKKHVASDPPTAKSLSQLMIQFIKTQETYVGRKAKKAPSQGFLVNSSKTSRPREKEAASATSCW